MPGTDRASLPTLAVVGATGAVGSVLCELITGRRNVWGEVRLIASARSAGRVVSVRGEDLTVRELTADAFDGVDVAIFDVPEDVSERWVPVATERGAVAVDNSATFRMDPDVPLVVPEVNPERVHNRPRSIVANPNCSTLAMVVGISALHREYGLRELIVSTYQAASGAGQPGIDALHDQLAKVAGDRTIGTRAGDVRQAVGDELGPFPAPLALNVVPWAGSLRDHGWSSEEVKLRNESRKILGLPDLKISATCVRVPVVTGHSVSVHAVFGAEVTTDDANEILKQAPGVVLVDDPAEGEFPTPADAVGTDPTWIGRVRRALDDPRALDLFMVGDNLRKGAALNAVQIAELIAAE